MSYGLVCLTVAVQLLFVGVPSVRAQPPPEPEVAKEDRGYPVPDSDRIKVSLQMAMGYIWDEAQNSSLGYEAQGRLGWAIVSLFGNFTDRFSYRVELNPVNESSPLAACGTPTFFYPNLAQDIGPGVRCENDGDKRVDDYKFIALVPLAQQGSLRQAYVDYRHQWFSIRFGRFILPLGFGWQEAGSFTAKDATHMQRLNAEANFGFQGTVVKKRADGSELAGLHAAAFMGEGNRNHDYDHFYFSDPTLDSNSAPSGLISASVRPFRGLDVRGAYKRGYTGSKVEYFPNYFANKHNDFAKIVSVDWRPSRFGRAFGEYAEYTWGPRESSALMVGADPKQILKNGYYVGGEFNYRVAKLKLNFNVTREELLRDDSLIKYIAAQGLWNVTMGKKERDTTVRFSADVGKHLTAGFFRMWLDNPFPVVSGIVEIPGDNLRRGSRRGGIFLLAHVP